MEQRPAPSVLQWKRERGKWVVSFILQLLCPQIKITKTPSVMLGGAQSWFTCSSKEKIPTPAGKLTLVVQPVASHFTDSYVSSTPKELNALLITTR